MGYFPPGVKTFNIYHSTYAGFIQKYKDSRSDDPFFIYRLLCEEMAEYISGYDRIKIAVSDGVKKELESIYGFKDVEVVYCSVDTSMFRKDDNRQELRDSLGIPRDAFVGIFVGRWENMQKRSKIMEHVIVSRPDIYWILVLGTGGDECELEGTPGVIVKRNVPYGDMHLMYSAADFMLFPSSYEGFGLVVIEAMACGLPVITTNVGIVTSIYRDKPFNTLLFDICGDSARDLKIIDEKMNLLKEDRDFMKEIGTKGVTLVKERFSLERWKTEMATLLEI
jgi:glycosyltransferase involved in cell wall biosynthesis